MRKLLIFSVLGLMALGTQAQNQKKALYESKFFDNWSVGLNVGSIAPVKPARNYNDRDFIQNQRLTFGLEFTKAFSPAFAFSIDGEGMVNNSPYRSKTAIEQVNVALLGKANLCNLLMGYKGTPRHFEVEAVAGPGLGFWFDGRYNQAAIKYMSGKMGLNFNFNLGKSRAWTVALKPALIYNFDGQYPPKIANHSTVHRYGTRFDINDAVFELRLGLAYHFKNSYGTHSFRRMTLDQSKIDGLNAQINALRGDLSNKDGQLADANRRVADLENQLNDCRNAKPVVVKENSKSTSSFLEAAISFRQSKWIIDPCQMPNIERVARYLQRHPEANLVIRGYASPEGNLPFNILLAKNRAEVVKKMLVKKYHISANRIDESGHGVGHMFSDPDWNRISICTINGGLDN